MFRTTVVFLVGSSPLKEILKAADSINKWSVNLYSAKKKFLSTLHEFKNNKYLTCLIAIAICWFPIIQSSFHHNERCNDPFNDVYGQTYNLRAAMLIVDSIPPLHSEKSLFVCNTGGEIEHWRHDSCLFKWMNLVLSYSKVSVPSLRRIKLSYDNLVRKLDHYVESRPIKCQFQCHVCPKHGNIYCWHFLCNAVTIGTDNSAQLYNLVNQNIYSISRKHVFLEYNFYLRL